jgi:hypothetical protein
MELFINDKRVEGPECDDSCALVELLRLAQEEFCPADHIIMSLRCDGLQVQAQEMESKLKRPVGDFRRVEVLTGTQPQLVREAMVQAQEALGATEAELGAIADQLIEGKIIESVQRLADSLAIWQQIHDAVSKSIQMLDLDPQSIIVEDQSLVEAIRGPKGMLLQVKEALEAKDYVMLADVLQYEFEPAVNTWQAILTEIQRLAVERESHSA